MIRVSKLICAGCGVEFETLSGYGQGRTNPVWAKMIIGGIIGIPIFLLVWRKRKEAGDSDHQYN